MSMSMQEQGITLFLHTLSPFIFENKYIPIAEFME
jgi:hypothetical protein